MAIVAHFLEKLCGPVLGPAIGVGLMMRALRFLLMVFVVVLSGAGIARAQDGASISPYVIADMPIDVSAENAVKAREKAFAEALNKAYGIMVERLVPNASERASMRTPDTAEIGRLLQDFATRNEKLSATRYTATYEMRFKPASVQRLIARLQSGEAVAVAGPGAGASVKSNSHSSHLSSPVQQSEQVNDLTLVLPFYQPEAQARLWSGHNPLRDALQRTNLSGSGLRAPLGDLEDIQAFDEADALTYTQPELNALLTRYNAARAVIAIAVPDQAGTTAPNGLSVMLYHAARGRDRPEYLQALAVSATGLPNEAAVYARAIDQMRAVLPAALAKVGGGVLAAQVATGPVPGNSPTNTAARPAKMTGPAQSVQMLARFQNLQEWQQMRGRLAALPQVQSVRILSLKTQEARLEVVHAGRIDDLQRALSEKGVKVAAGVVDIGSGSSIRPATMEPAAGNAGAMPVRIYTLTLDPWANAVTVKP